MRGVKVIARLGGIL